MKFLIDNQLPQTLTHWFMANGYDAVHVLNLELAQAPDQIIWQLAINANRIVVSKDEDFFLLATRPTDVGRLLWLRLGNCRKSALINAMERAWPQITVAFQSGLRIVEIK